jgi:imidazolonepropionase-like amidohydrolase
MQAIAAARLVDGTGAPPVADPLVVLDGDRIAEVLPGRAGAAPDGLAVVHLDGATIVPGLIDAHLHVAGALVNAIFPVDDPDAFADGFMSRLTEHGVTTVRDTGSPDVGRSFRAMKQRRPRWPRFFGSGYNLDGEPGGPWQGLHPLSGPAAAAPEVGALLDGGADFVKIYAWMGPETLAAVVAAAHGRGSRVAAHVGHRLTAEEAVRLGVDALEHVRIGRELVSDDDRARLDGRHRRQHDAMASFAAWRYIDPDGDRAAELISLLVDRGTFLTPTLCLSESILRPSERERLAGGWQAPEVVGRQWSGSAYDADYDAEDRAWAPVELRRQMEFVGRAREAGVRIAAGTDTPNPFIAPGSSIHRELELLVESGLTPLQAIQAATSTAADLLGRRDLGVVAPGRLADLVVVRGDPATDVRHLQQIEAVMIGGEFVVGGSPSERP